MTPPNILLITTDQQHHRLASYAGDRYVRTPNLDRLVDRGTRFELTYCANPVCVPSRSAMISGYMPHVFDGLEDNFQSRDASPPGIADWIDTPTMGELIRDAGYDVYYGGKLHVEGISAFTSEETGRFGFQSLTADTRDDLAHRSAEFLEGRNGDRPFFLWASLIQPHDICLVLDEDGKPRHPVDPSSTLPPLPENFEPPQDEPKWLEGFRDGTLGDEADVELGRNRAFGRAARNWTEEDWRTYRGAYRHHMADADRQIGIILDALERSGLADGTVVVYTSDHGDHDGEHRMTMKRSFYEASSHVPFIISWPGHVPSGRLDSTHLASSGIDLLPTLCDFAGGAVPESPPGRSLKPLALDDHVSGWREHLVVETIAGRMLRTKRFKYSLFHFEGRSEEMLCDMQDDPGETRNVATDPAHRQILTEHRTALREWAQRNHDSKGIAYLEAI